MGSSGQKSNDAEMIENCSQRMNSLRVQRNKGSDRVR